VATAVTVHPKGRLVTAPAPAADTSAAEHARQAAAVRLARLREGVRGIGRQRSGPSLERPVLIAGAVLLPLGVIVIILGWYGAAHTPRLFEQIPYAISGGILGGALVVAGGFLYVAAWLTRLVHENRRRDDQLAAGLARLEARMAAFVDAAPSPNGGATAAQPSDGAALVATASGTMFHRPDCPVVAGREGVRPVRADAPGYKPCRICEPLT
jgi:hypothetical protein